MEQTLSVVNLNNALVGRAAAGDVMARRRLASRVIRTASLPATLFEHAEEATESNSELPNAVPLLGNIDSRKNNILKGDKDLVLNNNHRVDVLEAERKGQDDLTNENRRRSSDSAYQSSEDMTSESPPVTFRPAPQSVVIVPVPMTLEESPMTPIRNDDEQALLAKLDMANQMLEAEQRSCKGFQSQTSRGHSRQASGSSIMSTTSATSSVSNLQYDEETGTQEELWAVWGKIVNDWESVIKKKTGLVKDMVRLGVPHQFRGAVWPLLCGANSTNAAAMFAEFLKLESPCEKHIRRDITRTYPEHEFFKEKNGLGQESLFNVMKAYSLHDAEVGYCQGSCFIVGLLLMQMPEEQAFAVLVQLMQQYRMRELFKPTMAELGLCMFQLESMIQDQLPDLYMHFQRQCLHVHMFASSWFLTLFTSNLPIPVACRVFDVFLSEGMEMVFRIAIALLLVCKATLMAMDMEGMLKFLQKQMASRFETDSDPLFTTAYAVKYNAKRMRKLEKEYNTLKTKEQEEQVELRRLRTENRLLRQRVDNLEKETATIADRLIQSQVICAQRDEETHHLRKERDTARSSESESAQRVDELARELRDARNRASSQASLSSQESQNEEKLQQLQKELKNKTDEECEALETIREQRDKIRELENRLVQLQQDPSVEMQLLQEELIACKMREAEANLSMKELKGKVMELDRAWQKHMEKVASQSTSSKTQQSLMDDVMSLRVKEAAALAELKEMKQRVMEMETQDHISQRQIRRLNDENDRLQSVIDKWEERDRDAKLSMEKLERQINDNESKKKEDEMMARLRDAEHSQGLAEMRQRVAELEIENQELVTAVQLQEKGDRQELENRISDLQEEILQLKLSRRLNSMSQLTLSQVANSDGSDYDSDLDTNELAEHTRLTLTSSYGPMESKALFAGSTPRVSADIDSSDLESPTDSIEQGQTQRKLRNKKKRSARGGLPRGLLPIDPMVTSSPAVFASVQPASHNNNNDDVTDNSAVPIASLPPTPQPQPESNSSQQSAQTPRGAFTDSSSQCSASSQGTT